MPFARLPTNELLSTLKERIGTLTGAQLLTALQLMGKLDNADLALLFELNKRLGEELVSEYVERWLRYKHLDNNCI